MLMRWKPPLWAVWTGLGVIGVAGFLLIPPLTLLSHLAYILIAVVSLLAILYGIRRNHPVMKTAWYLVAASQALTAIGSMCLAYYLLVRHDNSFPSLSDVFFLASCPPLVAGLFMMVRGRTSGRDRAGLLDASVIATGLALLSWTFLMRPVTEDVSLDLVSRLVSLAYPAVDVLLVGMVARLLFSAGARTPSYWLLCTSVTLVLVADVGFAAAHLYGSYDVGFLNAGRLLGYVLWAAAALHPSVRSLAESAPMRTVTLTRARIAVLAGTSLLSPALLVGEGIHRPADVDWAGVGVGGTVLFLLVLARMSGLVIQVRDQSAQLNIIAHSDGLTGVPNRRAWDLRLRTGLAMSAITHQNAHVAILDLDYFKKFNDSQGHQAGDRLLIEAGAVWTAQLRKGDLIARYGGEEFGLLIVAQSDDEVVAVIQRLRSATPQGQTFSAGLARWDNRESPEHLVDRADRALYRAKRDGRDRTVFDAADGAPILDIAEHAANA